MISPLAYVDPEAKIGENVTIHPFAFIDKDVEIGDGCEIKPYASILRGARLGKKVKVYQGAVISASPQDFRYKTDEKTYCHIGDEVSIREQVIINRGIRPGIGTNIGPETYVMAQTHIAHDTNIKGRSIIGNSVQIAGDVEVDEYCILSHSVILNEETKIGRYVFVKGGCRINGNVPPYAIMAHNPVEYGGVNAFALRYMKQPETVIDNIAKAYRHIYGSGTSVRNGIKRILADIPQCTERDNIVEFIKQHDCKIVAHENK